MAEIIEKDLSYQVVQAGYEVFNGLGPGFGEDIYENAMTVVLEKSGHVVEQQKRMKAYFQGVEMGLHKIDVIVDGRVILEFKAVSEIAIIHRQQAFAYLKATGLELALVMNFGASRLQVTRVVNSKQKGNSRNSPL